MKRVALYARRSGWADNFSIAGQLKEMQDAGLGSIVEEIEDPFEKRWTLDRPGVDRIRELAAAAMIDEVWAWRWDRFGESPWPEVLQLELEEYGVRLRSLDDSCVGEDAELLNDLKSLIVKRERRRLAERSRMGLLQKAREGKLIASKAPHYGYTFNESRDGYVVNEQQMRIVRRIFEWIGLDHLSLAGVIDRLHDEGIPSSTGGRLWDRAQIRSMVGNDVYKPHSREELLNLGVAPGVVAALPEGLYGVSWYGKRRVTLKSNKQQQVTWTELKDRVPIPVVDARIGIGVVEAARSAIRGNRAYARSGGRFWELSDGILICDECGRHMLAITQRASTRPDRIYHYYTCSRGRNKRDGGCSHKRNHPAADLEREVWERVSEFLSDPRLTRDALGKLIAQDACKQERAELAHWTMVLQDVESRSERLLDLYMDGKLGKDRYEQRVASLIAQEGTARAEIERLKLKRQMAESARQNMEALIESYAKGFPEDSEMLVPKQHHEIYRMFRLRVRLNNGGTVRMEGLLNVASDADHTCV